MKGILRKGAVALTTAIVAGVAAVPSATAAPADAVLRWNDFAMRTVGASGARSTPSAAVLYMGIVQAAVYDAVMAIEGTHEPYAFDGNAPNASVDAAVAAAAYGVLAEYFPSILVEDAYSDALADIPDGIAKNQGIEVGTQAAETMIALRENDGRNVPAPAPDAFDGTHPGEWRRTNMSAAPVTPYVANVTPFLAESPDQFRPKGPNPLTSHRYAVEFERTRLYGGLADTAQTELLRDPDQTEIATFWTENTVRQYNRALRGLATQHDLSAAEAARMFAMTELPAADAMITCWNTKYHYLGWRPATAIPQADQDGNPLTTADPDWKPFSTTANHPEYVSGHACLTGAITRGLQEFLGTKNIDMTITFVNSAGVEAYSHFFPTVEALRSEVEDARVFGGDHWTTGGVDGTALGDDLAKWALKRYFEEV